ncbi:MAG: hypothetical protein IJ561_07445 [Ruminococcus sp.]|nr:hypothetical protein [Ruminococcus sp.]
MDDKTKLSPQEREERRKKAQAGSERRQLIEHTRNVSLSEAEIAERKKIHAANRAKKKKQAAKRKRQAEKAAAKAARRENGSSGQRAMPVKGTSQDKKRTSKPVEKPAPKKEEKKAKKPKKEKAQKPADENTKKAYKAVEPSKTAAEEYAAKRAVELAAEDETIDMDDFRKARSRLKARKRLKKLIIVLILVIIAAVIYYTRSLWVPKLEGILDKPRQTVVNDGVVQSGYFPLEVSGTTSQISRLDGSLIYVDNGHIFTYDQNGKLRDTSYHSFGNPILRTNGKRLLLFDNKATGFKLYNKTGEMYEKTADGTILFGDLADNGNVLIVSEDDKYTVSLTVYDKNGEVVYNWQNGDRIMHASFTDGGDGILVSTFAISEGKTFSTVSYCDITKSNAVVTSSAIDDLVVAARRNKEGDIWVVTEKKLLLLSDNGSMISSYAFDTSVSHFDLCDDCACISTEGIGHNNEKIYIFNASDSSMKPSQPQNGVDTVERIRCFDGMAFVLSRNSLDAYSADGTLISTSSVTEENNDFVYIDEAVYLVSRRSINKILFEI